MENYICVTCGTQYAVSMQPPDACLICEDERQYIGYGGQRWTTLAELQKHHHNVYKQEEPGLVGIASEPRFAIGQRALLLQTPDGNVLWDCITVIDDVTVAYIQSLGGISKIAISHPHYYSSMIEWSKAFDNAPIYIHESEREWVMRPADAVHFWQGETMSLGTGLTLIRCGGHFDGSQVLHWENAADDHGVLLVGDTMVVAGDRRYVTFMYSYPNYIPLSLSKIRNILSALDPFEYDRLYSFRFDLDVKANAKAGVEFSAKRYIQAITDAQ